jgi:hypothetical protein
MKKRFIINPAFSCFCFLISIVSHSQDVFTNYLLKEDYAGKIDELRNDFGFNKSIPKEIELECLTALSYYPKLKNISIIFKFGKISSTMVSRPKPGSIFRNNNKREYQVIIRKKGTSKKGLEWSELSFNSLVGWIGHELAHIINYHHRAFGGILFMGMRYAFPQFRRRMERFTDQLTIKNDLGYALYEGTEYTLNSANISESYKKRIKKFYLSPAEIKKYISLKNSYKINYQKLRIVDLNAIVKIK